MVKIIGAGMAGLLAANMLWRRNPVVYEKQAELPHNHSAVLRFRTNLVGEVLGVPFKKVKVLKSTLPWKSPIADAMAYSMKVAREYRSDRSILPGTEIVERWIAPPDLIERMAEGVNIKYEVEYDFALDEKVISTIPMPTLRWKLGYPEPQEFNWLQGKNIRVHLRNCDAYLSIYVPDPGLEFSRLSITGNELIIECSSQWESISGERADAIVFKACDLLGISSSHIEYQEVRDQKYSKISPINEIERRKFIFWASTMTGQAFSLGRYATWRPGLMMDDVVQDIRLIDSWIDSPTPGYEQNIHHGRK